MYELCIKRYQEDIVSESRFEPTRIVSIYDSNTLYNFTLLLARNICTRYTAANSIGRKFFI